MASIDAVTWAFAGDHRPDLLQGLRVLARTAESPSIPFVTGAATPPELVEGLRQALVAIGREPAFQGVRDGLRLTVIGPAQDDAYDAILEHERQAAAAGYGEIG